jgi:hypothetical protein
MTIDEINAKGGGQGSSKRWSSTRVELAAVHGKGASADLAGQVAVVFGCWTSVSRKSVPVSRS